MALCAASMQNGGEEPSKCSFIHSQSIIRIGALRGFHSGGLRFQKRFPEANRNGEIRPAELTHHGELNSYNFAFIIEKRSARAARSGLGIIDSSVSAPARARIASRAVG
jgi:hypothetical protein